MGKPRIRGVFRQQACKPDSVEGDHPSRPPVARRLERRTRLLGGPLRTEPVCLAPDGVWLSAVSPRRWWPLTPPFHPYRRPLRRWVGGGFLSVPLSVGFRR